MPLASLPRTDPLYHFRADNAFRCGWVLRNSRALDDINYTGPTWPIRPIRWDEHNGFEEPTR